MAVVPMLSGMSVTQPSRACKTRFAALPFTTYPYADSHLALKYLPSDPRRAAASLLNKFAPRPICRQDLQIKW